MANVIFVTGGQRSGKSVFAEELALKLCSHPVYLATSRVWDEAHRQRIETHKQRRDKRWETIEEETTPSRHNFSNKCVLFDCVTLWLTNLFFDNDSSVDNALRIATKELDALFAQTGATFVFVSNEIGLGGHAPNELMYRFADLQGLVNQHIARFASEAYLIVSGIPVKIK